MRDLISILSIPALIIVWPNHFIDSMTSAAILCLLHFWSPYYPMSFLPQNVSLLPQACPYYPETRPSYPVRGKKDLHLGQQGLFCPSCPNQDDHDNCHHHQQHQ